MGRLVLNRRTGESLRIGDDVRLTVRDRRGSCVLVAVAAPLDVLVADEGDALRPVTTSNGSAFYLLWLLTGESLQLGDAVIVVGEATSAKRKVRGGQRQIRIAVIAPSGLVIRREEIARTDPHANSRRIADTHGYVIEDAA
jgi:sRNA-binding carbon storage regulator CsrA